MQNELSGQYVAIKNFANFLGLLGNDSIGFEKLKETKLLSKFINNFAVEIIETMN